MLSIAATNILVHACAVLDGAACYTPLTRTASAGGKLSATPPFAALAKSRFNIESTSPWVMRRDALHTSTHVEVPKLEIPAKGTRPVVIEEEECIHSAAHSIVLIAVEVRVHIKRATRRRHVHATAAKVRVGHECFHAGQIL